MAALYRDARPANFTQVVGQEHVKDVLLAALRKGRVGHAYMFSGPRGVGKTTMARLLAMAVNCESALQERPCGVCESCQLVRSNSHPDVTELDAASNNSVEDVRDIREKVRLSSLRGGKRIWVLDEAHMLSRAASNALLKTLEEPPDHLIFVLATTEAEKLPATILSRCQHFRFRRLSEEEISSKLQLLCQNAGVSVEDAALQLIAQAADGAMRDAESLLERLLTRGEAISFAQTEAALGLPPQTQMQKLARHLCAKDSAQLFKLATELYYAGFAPSGLAEHLNRCLRDALVNSVLKTEGFTLDVAEADLRRLIHALDDEQERFSRRDNLFMLEVCLIKAMNVLDHAPAETSPVAQPQVLPAFDPHRTPAPKESREKTKDKPLQPVVSSESAGKKINWHAVKTSASAQLKAFLLPAKEEIDGRHISLSFDERSKFHYSQLKSRQDELLGLIRNICGDDVELSLHGPGESSTKKS